MSLPNQDLDYAYTSPEGPRTRSQVQWVADIMLRTQIAATSTRQILNPIICS